MNWLPGGQPVQKPAAHRVQIERARVRCAQRVLHQRRRGGHVRVVGRAGGDDDQVEVFGAHLGPVERGARGVDGQRAGRLFGRGDAPLANPRARADPLV